MCDPLVLKIDLMFSEKFNVDLLPALRSMACENSLCFRISGGCMAPRIEDGARVRIRPARVYLPGDVLVVHRRAGKPVVHRFIGALPSGKGLRYFTQADHAGAPDGSFGRESILGKVCGGQCSPDIVDIPLLHRIRAAGRFLIFISTRLIRHSWSLLSAT